jgi:hypothetical protein
MTTTVLPTLKDMVASVLQQGEDEAKLAAAQPADETQPAQAPAPDTEQGQDKIASADALALADALDGAADAGAPEQVKVASAQGPMSTVLAKLGAGDIAPEYAPEAETNLGTTIAAKEPKKDKARTVPPVSESPLEGAVGPPKLQTNAEQDTPGKTPDNLLKASQARQEKLAALKSKILQKLAGEDVSPATISAPKTAQNPEDEAAPAQPQGGDRALISSNAAAISYTKGNAKATPKRMLRQVLDEPALSRATDSKLHENLKNAPAAGVKISEAQRERGLEALRKVASRVGTPEHAWLVDKVHQVREKRAAAQKNANAVRDAVRRHAFYGARAQ